MSTTTMKLSDSAAKSRTLSSSELADLSRSVEEIFLDAGMKAPVEGQVTVGSNGDHYSPTDLVPTSETSLSVRLEARNG